MVQTYTHRNGETEPPMTDGWYWMRLIPDGREDIRKFHFWGSGEKRYLYCKNDEGIEFCVPDDFGNDYQWWGPVTPPWKQQQDDLHAEAIREFEKWWADLKGQMEADGAHL